MIPKPQKKVNVSTLKELTWDQFSLYIRLRDAQKYRQLNPRSLTANMAPCVTCGRLYPILGLRCLQAGHFIPGRKNAYLFDERQVWAQCYNCNLTLKGNWPPYLEFMEKTFGKPAVDEMRTVQRQEIRKYTVPELEELLVDYKTRVKLLKEELDLA